MSKPVRGFLSKRRGMTSREGRPPDSRESARYPQGEWRRCHSLSVQLRCSTVGADRRSVASYPMMLLLLARRIAVNSEQTFVRCKGPNLAHSAIRQDPRALVRCFYGADFVKGVRQGSYPFSHPSVSLFDLVAVSSPRPTHRVAGARRSGQGRRSIGRPPTGLALMAPSTTAYVLWSG